MDLAAHMVEFLRREIGPAIKTHAPVVRLSTVNRAFHNALIERGWKINHAGTEYTKGPFRDFTMAEAIRAEKRIP